MVAVSNYVAAYDIRDGKILEWSASRIKMGMAKVNFASGDFTSGVSISGTLATAVNMASIYVANPIQVSDGIKHLNWTYNASRQALEARYCVSNQILVASGVVDISGNSIVLQVFGT